TSKRRSAATSDKCGGTFSTCPGLSLCRAGEPPALRQPLLNRHRPVGSGVHSLYLFHIPLQNSSGRRRPRHAPENHMTNPFMGKLALIVGGGPAPGINGVISSVTIEAVRDGLEVLGFRDGFKWLAQGDAEHLQPLSIDDVTGIQLRGGSVLGTS